MSDLVSVQREGAVLALTLNRPDKKNALTGAMYETLMAALASAGADAGVGVVLLSGDFEMAFAYRAQRSGARGWSDAWSAAEAMPEQVRLTIGDRRTGRLRIPVLVQALQVDAEVDCAGPARGCANARPERAAH